MAKVCVEFVLTGELSIFVKTLSDQTISGLIVERKVQAQKPN